MCSSIEKQETDSVKWTKYHGFREQKMPFIENLSAGRSGRTTGSPTV